MSTVTYYFNAYGAEQWTDPGNMTDGLLTSYASTASKTQVQLLNANDCPGTDLGSISAVELRVYAYGDGDDTILLRPVFGGSADGNDHSVTPGTSGAWSAYQDITNDPNAPGSWGWSDVQGLDCDVEFATTAKGNTMYAAKVE
ncbi:MAG: hypothetical protein ACP5G7_12155, partial [Anaerolineae bacterium]